LNVGIGWIFNTWCRLRSATKLCNAAAADGPKYRLDQSGPEEGGQNENGRRKIGAKPEQQR
jgi:hypothetical protein